jgi:hypothetical protein
MRGHARPVELLADAVLEDPAYRVPSAPGGSTGLAWLRARVARFSDGAEHRRRRALAEEVIAGLRDADGAASPTRSLLRALGLPEDTEADVALVAAAYQPHAPQSEAADAAADRLVEACGGRTEQAAARVGVLVQAHAATLALVEARRTGSDAPPVPATRRIAPDGTEVAVDLTDAHFGRGPHRCPGEDLATRLAEEALR